MSTYFVVRLRAATAPEGLEAVHAADQLALSVRGRPCGIDKAARLESAALAGALVDVSRDPIHGRCGADIQFAIESRVDDGDDAAERIARDSEAVRDLLANLPPAVAEAAAQAD